MGPVFELLYRNHQSLFIRSFSLIALHKVGTMKEFMVSNTRIDTLNMFADMSQNGPFEDKQSKYLLFASVHNVKLKTTFEIGFNFSAFPKY